MDSDDEIDSQDVLGAFGNDVLVRAVRNPERVRQLLLQRCFVTEDAIRAAFACENVDTLQLFLNTGAPFDTRSRACQNPSARVDGDWTNKDETPIFATEQAFSREDRDDWYAIQHAAFLPTRDRDARDQQAAIMSALLDRQPDLFAVYPQRLSSSTINVFPGEQKKQHTSSSAQERTPEHGEPSYGLRSVLHSILEDGGRVDPILNHPGLDLDLEHCDPQGRTLFLSMCRSSIGADARTDAVLHDVEDCRIRGTWIINPFATTEVSPSLFNALHAHGANLLAVDNSGKNALHHLLESADHKTYDYRPTGIRNALQYMLQHCPTLVNQPDHHGTYPIHSALQRLRRYPIRRLWEENAGLDTVVEDLLAAGADALARDGKGNTCLHYCSDSGLTEELMGDHARRLFRHFLDSGVDINVRNHAGQSALDMVFKDNGKSAQRLMGGYLNFGTQSDSFTAAKIDEDVLERASASGDAN